MGAPPLSLSLRWLSIVASGEGGGHCGRQNPIKGNARPLSVNKIVISIVTSGVGIVGWGAKSLQKIMAPLLSLSLR